MLKSDPCLILGWIRGDIPVYIGAAGAVASKAALGLVVQITLSITYSDPVGVGPAYPILIVSHRPCPSSWDDSLGRESGIIRMLPIWRNHRIQPFPPFRRDLFPFMPIPHCPQTPLAEITPSKSKAEQYNE